VGQGKCLHETDSAGVSRARPAYTTITNTMYRMEVKKVVLRVRKVGNADIFEPLIARDAARENLLDEILSFFGGRAQPMMAQLIESGKLTLEDIRELEKAAVEADRQRKAERMRKSK
jgi:BlaI family transcriptional regulator, penicillinase repressor